MYGVNADFYPKIINDFNKYSFENNLDITLKLTTLTSSNSTAYINDYGFMIKTLLTKRSKKYNIYFFYDSFIKDYGVHFMNLKEYLNDDYIKKFSSELIKKGYMNNDNLIGVVKI